MGPVVALNVDTSKSINDCYTRINLNCDIQNMSIESHLLNKVVQNTRFQNG